MASERDTSKGFIAVRTTSVEYDVEKPPSSYIGLAIFTTVLNLVFGLAAVFLSVSSISSRKEGNLKAAKDKGKKAMIVSFVGIAVTCLLVIFLVVYFVVIAPPDNNDTAMVKVEGEVSADFLESVWQKRIKEYTRPRWCEWYGYNSWYCKGPL